MFGGKVSFDSQLLANNNSYADLIENRPLDHASTTIHPRYLGASLEDTKELLLKPQFSGEQRSSPCQISSRNTLLSEINVSLI